MNILANALGVEFTTLFIEDNENDATKLENAEAKLDYQLSMRRSEYKGYYTLINGLLMIIMLGFIPALIMFGSRWWLWMTWGIAWTLLYPIYQFFVITFIDPKLDKKYPLTKFRTDKNEEDG